MEVNTLNELNHSKKEKNQMNLLILVSNILYINIELSVYK